uniref:Myb/SANT-like domain-containing protein n=1 Tax=Leersia perrieri TaxID=77586 RepID=A0A0D9XBA6_9ORYZ
MNKHQIQDKEKELKHDYRMLKEARKQSGVSWDNQRCMIIACDAVWANLIESNDKVKKFRKNKSFPLFDALGELYDRQTAEGSMNFTSIEPPRHATLTQVGDYPERSDSFPDVNWVPQDYEGLTTEVEVEENTMEHENQQTHVGTTSRGRGEKDGNKRKSASRERVDKLVKRNRRNDVFDLMGSYLEMRKEEEAKARVETTKVDECSIRNCIAVVESMEDLSVDEKVKSFGIFNDAHNREIFMSAGSSTRLAWLRTMLF